MKETNILQLVRLKASQLGCVLHRNNIGAYKDPKGYYIKYGVCNPGGSDLIGWRTLPSGIAQFLAIECKIPGKKPTPEQHNFIDAVNKAGGLAAFVTSPEELENILK